MNNLGLTVVVAATRQHKVATTTFPAKGNAISLVFLKDATVVQNTCAAASAASSPVPVFALAHVSAFSGADVVASGLKAKLFNLGLSLKDNTQSQFPVAVSSLSSLSSKAPITNPGPAADTVSVNEIGLELKATGPLPSVEGKLRVLDAALVALRKAAQTIRAKIQSNQRYGKRRHRKQRKSTDAPYHRILVLL